MSRKKVTEENKKQEEKQNTGQQKNSKKAEKETISTDRQEVEEQEEKSEVEEESRQEQECKEAKEDARDEIELLKRQLEDLNDKHLRLIAEYDNFRKRTLREKMELSKSAGEGLLLGLLPVIDDFDRARAHLGTASDLDAVKEGIGLIYNKFKEFLKQQGVTEIETEEQEFDSELHEAVTKIPAPSEDKKGKIIDCIQKGYKLNDKVIRYPKVVVGE
ncbi:nucleotide exchange factor GrpE [Anaerophaga thermohalophila]|jgi:molecular chaperone GrpE|uniref:nucleotide exchange factor GrpE n=1 Tax=Anaerophaga thermohalophila TaxID=177400 RepID=UPI000301A098|nr:nucleotide exchange factor GrpE [Anaerophaga thermohalophila]